MTNIRQGVNGWFPRDVRQLPERVDIATAGPFIGSSWIEQVAAWWALSGAVVVIDRATRDPFQNEDGSRSS